MYLYTSAFIEDQKDERCPDPDYLDLIIVVIHNFVEDEQTDEERVTPLANGLDHGGR